ncbi:MAG: ATP-binding protein [Treponema sp.]|nr:ATP-binding protein [Treponema sp.]
MHFTLMDLVTDIAQNGIESGADVVELELRETLNASGGEFRFTVKDNGKGMTAAELKLAQDPFVTDGVKHPGRKVGLGLPFLIQTSEQSGGGWKIDSEKRQQAPSGTTDGTPQAAKASGTTVSAWFNLGNVDTPPVGDIPGMFRTSLLFEGPAEMVIKRFRQTPEGITDYEIRKTELVDALGGIEDVQSIILLDRYLRSLEEHEGD